MWMKEKELPGLAMSRSLGDRLAHKVGVISKPGITIFIYLIMLIDVSIYKLNREEYEYTIVSASDGIWDALETTEVKEFIQNYK